MCGICGYGGGGWEDGGEGLRAMAGAMVHRGPDDSGFHLAGQLGGLGHRRLSIIDLSPAGRQPMSNEAGTVHTIVNGEIYNFRELRRELEGLGHSFRGDCDAEVLPHAYEEWGDSFPTRLRGMFAAALLDENRRRLLLLRDRLGIKPLYYHRSPAGLLFASELKALAAHPAYPREVSPEGLYWYLAFGYVPAPYTIFRDTWKLRAGHILVLEDGRERLERWWDPLASALGPRERGSEEHLLDLLDEAVSRSVRYRLVSDVPLGAFLSGGIDSSLVVAQMCRQASGAVKTFTIGFLEEGYDEAGHARAVADYLGTEHTELCVTPREALEVIPRLPDIYDEPFGDSSAIPTFLVSQLARRSVTVALSGDGGDELFCGYPRYYWFHLARPLALLPRALRRALGPAVGRLRHPKSRKAASWLGFADQLELYRGMVGIWNKGDLGRLLGREADAEDLDFRRVWEAARGRHHLERLMLVDLHTYLPEDILTKVDRASMAHSLEARVPLLDHDVVELALRLPFAMKFRRRQGKHLLRCLLARYLPRELFERPKMGFGVPVGAWFRKELKEMLLDYTSPDRLAREGFLDPAPVQEMVREHLEGRRNHQYQLWVLLAFQLWRERYGA